MKKEVKINQISKEELYKLYLESINKLEALEAKCYAQQQELAELTKKLEEANFQLFQRNKVIFGKRREKIEDQANEFNEAEKENVVKKERKSNNTLSREFLESHFSEEIILNPDEINTISNLVKIGEDVSYKLETTPARLKIIKIISNKYVDSKEGKIYQKVKNDDKYPHSFCTPSFASEILINKFVLGVPYYRQENYLFDDGITISRQNLCNYQLKTSEILRPMYDYLIKKLLATKVKILHADETTLRVLDINKSKCYVWLFNSSFYENPIFIYKFSNTRSRDIPVEFLKDYEGYLITDCYSGYNEIPNVVNSYCWVHARRKFVEILDFVPEELKENSISNKVIKEIDSMFKLEQEYRREKYKASEIKELRNTGEFKKHLDNIFEILSNANPVSKSKLDEAINYILKRKESFLEILNDGHLELSNNSAERGIKPFVIARKNFLFSNTKCGAESSTIIFSIIQTAIANRIDYRKYLETLINKISFNSTEEELEELLPWNIKL
jgi:transposase